ncbi:MAG: M50 family metallopeptidase [Firmicutes bacterium]|nr:M50 family metallopeptidase [Bacillota bacterium]
MGQEQNSSKEKNRGLPWQLLIALPVGAIAGFYLASRLSFTDFLWTALFIFIGLFVNINIHEIGHFLFGRLSGYQLISYRISIFAWNKENQRMKFSIMKSKGYGGLCAMMPPEKELSNLQHGLFYAGGLIMNFLTGGLLVLASLTVWAEFSLLANFTLTTGIVAILLATLNFMPFVSENNPTDGKIIWSLILKKPFARKLMEINKAGAQLAAGVRPRDLQFTREELPESPLVVDLMAVLYAYFIALDADNRDDVLFYAGILEDNIHLFPAPMLPGIYYELCFTGCVFNNHSMARRYHRKAGKILQADKDVNGLRVKAYYEFYVSQNPEAAMGYVEAALAVADKFPIKGQAKMEADLVRELQKHIISAPPAPAGR